ncbi:MAG: type II toxin-antitoxin system Phd/YefM family antitoxin [Acidobacteria bacterium]|nr:type II toxin-antitoxin system Phd/YefM family antitoxin [Acidobacteriota bacterium]
MKTATLTETKNQLSALIDQVRHGETILILDRGRPVARLSSVLADDATASEGRIERLERQGILRRAKDPKPMEVLSAAPPRAREGASIVDALIEERRSGR